MILFAKFVGLLIMSFTMVFAESSWVMRLTPLILPVLALRSMVRIRLPMISRVPVFVRMILILGGSLAALIQPIMTWLLFL